MNRDDRLKAGLTERQKLEASGIKFTQLCGLSELSGYAELYYLTEDGQVWSDYQGDYLRPSATNSDGYRQVGLMRKDGSRKTFYIHQLMAVMKFGRFPKDGEEVRHLDGDKHNNRLENIDLASRELNVSDRIKHGRCAKPYTDTQIRHTRGFGPHIGKTAKEWQSGLSKAKLMARSGVASSAMGTIIQRKQRAEVPDIPDGCEGVILGLDSVTESGWTSELEEAGPAISPGEVLEAIKTDEPETWEKLKDELEVDQH